MQNLMIIDNNILYIQKVVSNISKNLNNVKIYSFYSNKNSTIFEEIENKEVDIILINVEFAGLDIVDFIYKNSINVYNKSIILLCKNSKLVKLLYKEEYNKYIYTCVKVSEDITNLISTLRKVTFYKENTSDEIMVKARISRELKKLRYNFSNIGTEYILESIYIVYKNKIYNLNLSKHVYPILSEKYKKSINTIRCNITTATRIMYCECEERFIMEYFGYLDPDKPEVKEVITTIFEKI